MDNFFRTGFNLKPHNPKSFLSDKKTVCIKHSNGKITEHPGITDPWKYIAKVKKESDVEDAWLKEDI